MSDYFFYDLNKKMADLASKQQLTEDAAAAPAKSVRSQLNERDLGKHNNATTGFAALAKKTGGGEKGAKIAGAQLAKMRAKGQVKSAARGAKKDMDESAFQAAIGKKKYGDQGMKALQKAGRNHASNSTMNNIRNRYDKYDESMTDEGNAFSKAVVDAKRDGVQPGEKITVGGKQYPVREQGVAEGVNDDAMAGLQKTIDFAKQHGYKIYRSPTGRKMRFVNKTIDHEIRASVDNDGDSINVNYMDMTNGTSGNDDASYFDETFKRAYNEALSDYEYRMDDQEERTGMKEAEAPQGVAEAGAPNAMAPMNPDGATAPPAKGADGQYPVVTSGPNKGKRWSPNTPGPTNPSMKEAAKYRDPKYKDKLYTQQPPDYTYGPDYDDAYDNPKPDNYAGRKRKIGGGSGDPLTRGFRMSADNSINTHGKRKGMPSRDQITSLKGSIKDVLGKHTEPNLPEGGIPMTAKQQKFAKLAPPVDKITFADRIVGAKKEVDEVLGDVAAKAMKKAVASNWSNLGSEYQDRPMKSGERRKTHTGGEIEQTSPGVTRHHAGKSYSGAGYDDSADAGSTGSVGRRRVGAGLGKKIGAKINTGKSKLMTREGDMDPADQGEYDQEGSMAKDDIKTVVRHAQALEKILGDNDNLPEWVQAKLAKIEGMMTAVDDYMQNQQGDDEGSDEMEMDEESTNKRDNRAERAGKKVTKDIEYDEKKVKEGSGPKEKQKTPYRDINGPGYKAAANKQKQKMATDKAAEPGKKLAGNIDKKKKEVDETTTSGSVATGSAAPKSGGGMSYGKGIYDSLDRQVEKMIAESMSINMSMNNDAHGGPSNTLTVTATDEDALQLAMLLKSAGLGSQDHGDMSAIHNMDNDMSAIHDMDHDHGDETCPACGSTDCECDEVQEAYGDTDASENSPDYPTDQVYTSMDQSTDPINNDVNKDKGTGQTTIPVIAGQKDRMGYNGDHELRRMMEIAGFAR